MMILIYIILHAHIWMTAYMHIRKLWRQFKAFTQQFQMAYERVMHAAQHTIFIYICLWYIIIIHGNQRWIFLFTRKEMEIAVLRSVLGFFSSCISAYLQCWFVAVDCLSRKKNKERIVCTTNACNGWTNYAAAHFSSRCVMKEKRRKK